MCRGTKQILGQSGGRCETDMRRGTQPNNTSKERCDWREGKCAGWDHATESLLPVQPMLATASDSTNALAAAASKRHTQCLCCCPWHKQPLLPVLPAWQQECQSTTSLARCPRTAARCCHALGCAADTLRHRQSHQRQIYTARFSLLMHNTGLLRPSRCRWQISFSGWASARTAAPLLSRPATLRHGTEQEVERDSTDGDWRWLLVVGHGGQ